MAIYKVVGMAAKIVDGAMRYVFHKTYVRADNEDDAEVKAHLLDVKDPKVAFFCNDPLNEMLQG